MRWPLLTLGFALAYVLYYVAGQLESDAVAKGLRRVGLVIALVSLAGILLGRISSAD